MSKKVLALLVIVLSVVFVTGLLWLATQADNSVSATLSFAAGLSMIFLPCTLPLAFVIVPLAARERRAGRGIGIAVSFVLGLAVMLTIYGVAVALLGGYFGLDQFTRGMFLVAGIMATLFGLSELGLFRLPLPVFTHRIPNWTQGYGKSFFLGLLLGNAGIGCPNPAFYVLLTYIASTGSVFVGGWLGLVHGVGRALPLILLVALALIGMKSMQWTSKVSDRIERWMGGALVAVGAFITTYGVFGMHWWEDSVFHATWNQFVLDIAPNLAEAPDHPVAQGIYEASSAVGWWSLILLILIPLVWYKLARGMKHTFFVPVLAILLALGIAASVGALEVEHGHGVEDANHIDEHSTR